MRLIMLEMNNIVMVEKITGVLQFDVDIIIFSSTSILLLANIG